MAGPVAFQDSAARRCAALLQSGLLQKLKCGRKEPCRLFSVKQSEQHSAVAEATLSSLCSCPHGHRCPRHHTDTGVVPGRVYTDQTVRTYTGYCM